MIPAIVVAHLSRRFAAQPDRTRHQRQLAIYLGSLALIAIGLAVIGQLSLATLIVSVTRVTMSAMSAIIAFFDMDYTVLDTSSGLEYVKHLREQKRIGARLAAAHRVVEHDV